jgi:predicted TIM-barrel fold metal-dependent hydrolase
MDTPAIDQRAPDTPATDTPATGRPTIDSHAHVYPFDEALIANAWHRPSRPAPIEGYLAELERNGIGRGVLAGASIYGDRNDYALAACEANANLRATLIVKPDVSLQALRDMGKRGAVGVRLQLMHYPMPDLDNADHRQLYRYIADLGWHIHVHDNAARLPYALPILERAGVPLVVDHFGRPDPVERLESEGFRTLLRLVGNGRTWVKLAAGYRLQDADLVAEAGAKLLAETPPDRVLWGSDWPFSGFEGRVSYGDSLDEFARLVQTPEARLAIGTTNPAALYFGES